MAILRGRGYIEGTWLYLEDVSIIFTRKTDEF